MSDYFHNPHGLLLPVIFAFEAEQHGKGIIKMERLCAFEGSRFYLETALKPEKTMKGASVNCSTHLPISEVVTSRLGITNEV